MGWSTRAMSELGRNLFERITKEYSENTSSRMGVGGVSRPGLLSLDEIAAEAAGKKTPSRFTQVTVKRRQP